MANPIPAAMPWIGDLFARCWDALSQDDVNQITTVGVGPEGGPVVEALFGLLAEAGDGHVPAAVLAYLDGDPVLDTPLEATHDPPTRSFLVGSAIDRLLGEIRPFAPRSAARSPALRALDEHYRRTGRYNRDASGVVLPRGQLGPLAPPIDLDAPPNPESGNHRASLFRFLTRSVEVRLSVQRPPPSRLDAALDLDPEQIRIAVAPWAETREYLGFTAEVIEAVPWVHVCISDGAESDLTTRAADLVRALADQAATIAVLPEFVVSPAAVRALGQALKAEVRAREDFALELLIAGSGLSEATHASGLAYNESVVLSRRGDVLWRQRKAHQYAMEPDTMSQYGLKGAVVGEKRHRERFYPGQLVEVRDSRVGRAIVLICEDLAQDEPGAAIIGALRPDWLFVPVLDGELQTGRWMHQRAYAIATGHGTHCVVATSLVLPLRKTLDQQTFKVGLCVGGRSNVCDPGRFVQLEVDCADPPPRVAVARWTPKAWSPTWLTAGK